MAIHGIGGKTADNGEVTPSAIPRPARVGLAVALVLLVTAVLAWPLAPRTTDAGPNAAEAADTNLVPDTAATEDASNAEATQERSAAAKVTDRTGQPRNTSVDAENDDSTAEKTTEKQQKKQKQADRADPKKGGTTTPRTNAPLTGDGTFATAAGSSPVHGSGWRFTYQVEVERGLPITPRQVAAQIDRILGDQRSWIGAGGLSVQRLSSGAGVQIKVSSPGTTDALCYPLQTNGELSCRTGSQVVINAKRWLQGSPNVPASLDVYRTYLVNHEVGHALGHGHVYCPEPGALAPVMQQQSKGMQGCRPNGWPFPGAGR